MLYVCLGERLKKKLLVPCLLKIDFVNVWDSKTEAQDIAEVKFVINKMQYLFWAYPQKVEWKQHTS